MQFDKHHSLTAKNINLPVCFISIGSVTNLMSSLFLSLSLPDKYHLLLNKLCPTDSSQLYTVYGQ